MLDWFILDCILISLSVNSNTAIIYFETVRIVWICLSVQSDNPLEIKQLVHALLLREPVTVHQVMFFLGKTFLCQSSCTT